MELSIHHAAIAQLIGNPWVAGAAGPQAFDCYGLVRYVYRTWGGVDLPIVAVDTQQALAVRHTVARAAASHGWQAFPAGSQTDGDVVLLSHAKHPHHVGLWLDCDGGGLLHAVEGAGVLFQNLQSLKLHHWNLVGGVRWQP